MRKAPLFIVIILALVAVSCKEKRELVKIKTEHGEMLVWLYDTTSQHKQNFLKLAKEGFYDSLLFHRVIEGFMIQGGDPESKHAAPGKQLGGGGPGYTIPAEFRQQLIHKKGALSAARMGDQQNPQKASSGSQFYIVQGKTYPADQLRSAGLSQEQVQAYSTVGGTPHLDGSYTVFGQVIDGLDVIDKIAAVQKGQADRPQKDVRMEMEVVEMTLQEIKEKYGFVPPSAKEEKK